MKLVWKQGTFNKNLLYAMMQHADGAATPTGLREDHLLPVQLWCEQTRCGKRIAFDTFTFKTEEEMTTFLLRWS